MQHSSQVSTSYFRKHNNNEKDDARIHDESRTQKEMKEHMMNPELT